MTAFHVGRAQHSSSSLCYTCRSLEPAIKRFIRGGGDKDPVQSLQVMRGQIRITSSGVLKSEFTE